MTEPTLHPDLRIVLEAVSRGWLEVSASSRVINILIRARAFGGPFDLDAWLLQNDRLSVHQLQELRALPPTSSSEENGMDETAIESRSPSSEPLFKIGSTRLNQLDHSIRKMWTMETSDVPSGNLPTLPDKFLRYTDFEIIGSGGMGQILRATDPKIDRQIAIKTLHPKLLSNRSTLNRFQREARITGQLEHPNIVPVHDAGQSPDGTHFFCMKLVGGESLAEVLQGLSALHAERETAHDGTRLLPEFLKICDAMEFAHSRGVIHRDLKPANIMIGSFGEVLVMDWGLAKNVLSDTQEQTSCELEIQELDQEHFRNYLDTIIPDSTLTQDGTILGTLDYMPPEQAAGKVEEIDQQSDLYSLGAILYELLTLKPPLSGKLKIARLAQIIRGKFPPPRECNPEAFIPRDLEAVVLKAMAREKADRYPSVSEMKVDLQAFLQGRTLEAATYNPMQLLAKWIARNRKMCVGAAAVFVLSLTIFGLIRWNEARDRQQQFSAA